MSYYALANSEGKIFEVRHFDGARTRRIGVKDVYMPVQAGETFTDVMNRTLWNWQIKGISLHELTLEPGQYYSRMARPLDQHSLQSPGFSPSIRTHANEIASLRGQLTALTRRLGDLCQVIHPGPATFDSYGHEIRNLLILACTEVETHWRAILNENGVANARSTRDYVKLAPAMKLSQYALSFPQFPWLAPIAPFKNWAVGSPTPTQDIQWYDAYNAVKHDREAHFARGKLLHAFEAVSACAVMMCAQFGTAEAFGFHTDLRAFFELAATPIWSPTEIYTYPYADTGQSWAAVSFPF